VPGAAHRSAHAGTCLLIFVGRHDASNPNGPRWPHLHTHTHTHPQSFDFVHAHTARCAHTQSPVWAPQSERQRSTSRAEDTQGLGRPSPARAGAQQHSSCRQGRAAQAAARLMWLGPRRNQYTLGASISCVTLHATGMPAPLINSCMHFAASGGHDSNARPSPWLTAGTAVCASSISLAASWVQLPAGGRFATQAQDRLAQRSLRCSTQARPLPSHPMARQAQPPHSSPLDSRTNRARARRGERTLINMCAANAQGRKKGEW
jgi:hypothetical protein